MSERPQPSATPATDPRTDELGDMREIARTDDPAAGLARDAGAAAHAETAALDAAARLPGDDGAIAAIEARAGASAGAVERASRSATVGESALHVHDAALAVDVPERARAGTKRTSETATLAGFSAGRASNAGAGIDVVARHGALLSRTALVSSLTLLSRIAGFVRETKTAALFGDASGVSDAFITAWRVPNTFRALMGEGAIVTSLQTEMTLADHEHGDAAGRALFHALLRIVAGFLVVACAAAMLATWVVPDRMPFTGWAWLGAQPAAVREFTMRMLPFVVLVCLSAVISGALNVRGRFFAPSIAPVVMNLGWIAALVAVGRAFGQHPDRTAVAAAELVRQMAMARWLATYVLVAGAILVVVQLPALRRAGLADRSTRVEREHARRAAWSALRTSVPLVLGAAAFQINVLVCGLLALALLPAGGSSLLYYVTRLQQLPLSLVAAAATSAVFPLLSALGARGELGRMRELHDRTHLAVAYVAIPASLGLCFFAAPILAACFQHGEFGAEGVARAAWGLRALALAVLPAGAAGLVVRTYYALGDLRTPVRVAVATLVLNVLLSLLFVAGLGWDLEGLAWSTAISAWVQLGLLLPGLTRDLRLPAGEAHAGARFAVISLAALASTGAAWGAHAMLGSHTGRTSGLALCIFLAVALYAVFSQVLGIEEWRVLRARLRRDPAPSSR